MTEPQSDAPSKRCVGGRPPRLYLCWLRGRLRGLSSVRAHIRHWLRRRQRFHCVLHRRRGRRSDPVCRSCRSWHFRPLVLEALPAQHRSALGRLERHCRGNAALRTLCPRLGARNPRRRRTTARSRICACRPPGLARLTAFGVVLEILVYEKQLFPSGEDKLTTAIDAS